MLGPRTVSVETVIVRGTGMDAAMVGMSASEPRERLLASVDEIVGPLPHVRQRANALVYVRGLVEEGGRKSLQPTLFRLGESSARYESLQQMTSAIPATATVTARGFRLGRGWRTSVGVRGRSADAGSELRRERLSSLG